MTSLKRSPESHDINDRGDLLTPPSSFHSSQQSCTISPSSFEEEPFLGDHGWSSIWNELIGTSHLDNVGADIDETCAIDDDFTFDLPRDGESNIESWAAQEFSQAPTSNVSESLEELTPNTYGRDNSLDVCYGMIYRAKLLLVGRMSDVLESLTSPDVAQVGSHFLLDIHFGDDKLFLALPHGLRVAQLSEHLYGALKDLVNGQSIQMQAIVHKQTIFEDIARATKSKDASTTININLYGPSASSHNVGHHLSFHKVWLQRPDWHKYGLSYCNPHVLKIVDTLDHDEQLQSEDPDSSVGNSNLQESLNQVYASLTRHSDLQGVAGDVSLRTPLLSHQEKALEFMVQRETGPLPEKFRLWDPVTEDDQIWYYHNVTGNKSRTLPSETGGGILADEMGMGKTFSILALVVKSLETAQEWSLDTTTHLTDAISPSKLLSCATLVVVPSPLLLKSWIDESQTRLNTPLRILVHHGMERPTAAEKLIGYDVVLTTYHTLIADHNKKQTPVADVAWYRIVLDEAHFIRRSATFLHKRVAELDSKFRWCLTGTPMQNSLDDLGALLAFLRIFPFDRLCIFRQCVTVPFLEGGNRRIAGQKNLTKLLDAICIRHTKELLNLSNLDEKIHYVAFTDDERFQYNKTKEDMNRAMRNVADSSVSKSRFGMFQAQLQLRLLCNHGTFQHQFHWTRARNMLDEREDAFSLTGLPGDTKCSSCRQELSFTDLESTYKLQKSCSHMLCSDCRIDATEICQICEATKSVSKHPTEGDFTRKQLSRAAYFRNEGQSSKMVALVQDLQAVERSEKSIVFSHWTTTLDLISRHLHEHDMSFERIDGTDDFKHRQKVLDRFRLDPDLPVLIMTTGVGAFGLDLITANRVHLVEPQWNPSVELQAIGRTLRIGQQKSVKVIRYIVTNTVEKDMRQLQQKKLNMAGMAKTGSGTNDAKIKAEH